MALLSELVQVVAKHEGLEEVSVGIFARHAREAGFISQGGRGRSAAKMSFRDAANLLIAVNGCALAKEVAGKVPIIRALPVRKSTERNVTGLGKLGVVFGDDFEAILEMMSAEDRFSVPGTTFIRFFKPTPIVEVTSWPSTEAGQKEERIRYEDVGAGTGWNIPDRSDETVISHVTLQSVAKLIIS